MFFIDKLNLLNLSKKKKTEVINFKTDTETKKGFFNYCENENIIPSTLLNNFIKGIITSGNTIMKNNNVTLLRSFLEENDDENIHKKDIFKGNDYLRIGTTIFNKEVKQVSLSEDMIDNNLLIVGSSGSGKSVLNRSIISQLVEKNKGFIFFNSKGDVEESEFILNEFVKTNNAEDLYFIDITNKNYKTKINKNRHYKADKILFTEWIGRDIIFQSLFTSNEAFYAERLKTIINNYKDIETYLKEYKKDLKEDNPNDRFDKIVLQSILYMSERLEEFYTKYSETFVNLKENINYCFLNNKSLVLNLPFYFEREIYNLIYLKLLNEIEFDKIKINKDTYYLFLEGTSEDNTSSEFLYTMRKYGVSIIQNVQDLQYNRHDMDYFKTSILLKNYDVKTDEYYQNLLGVNINKLIRSNMLKPGTGYIVYEHSIHAIQFNYYNFDYSNQVIPKHYYIEKSDIRYLEINYSEIVDNTYNDFNEKSLILNNSDFEDRFNFENNNIIDKSDYYNKNIILNEDIEDIYNFNRKGYLTEFNNISDINEGLIIINPLEVKNYLIKIDNLNISGIENIKIVITNLLNKIYKERNSNFEKFEKELHFYLKYVQFQETFVLIMFYLFDKYFFNINMNMFQELKYKNPSLYYGLDSISKNEINRYGLIVWFDFYLIKNKKITLSK